MKRLINYTLLIFCTLSMTNCDDFIDEEPISVITSTSFWSSEADAQAGIIGMYDRLQVIYRAEFGEFIHWTDGRSDVAVAGQTDAINIVQELLINNLTPTSLGTNWGPLYEAISMANFAIVNIPNINMDETTQNELLGEAYFVRAYCYFLAVRVWGDVPLLVDPVSDASQDLKPVRTARATVLQQVREDIEAALSRLPTSYGAATADRGRATVGAAEALKIDFLMWMARVEGSGNTDLQEAANVASLLLSNSMYELLGNYGDVFAVKNNNETIWAIQYDFASQESGNLGADMTPLAEGPFTGGKMYYQLSDKVLDAFNNAPATDLRAAATFVQFDAIGANNMCIKYVGSPAQGTQRNFDSNLIMYRVGGIKLMYAEALNELGDTNDAIDQLNDIRNRAGLPNTTASTQSEVRQAILDEHLVEMAFEGSRWFTLIRSGQIADEVDNVSTNTFNENSRLLWPVAEVSIRQNENLSQNGAYQ